MKRRDFLLSSAILSVLGLSSAEAAKKQVQKPIKKKVVPKKNATLPKKAPKSTAAKPAVTQTNSPVAPPRNAISLPDEPDSRWQTYDIQTTIVLKHVSGKQRLWLPLVLYKDSLWQRSFGHEWEGNFARAGIYRDPIADMEIFYAEWPANEENSAATASGRELPRLKITSTVATQNRHFDITRRNALLEKPEILRKNLRETRLVPTDGIVRQTAEQAIGRIKDPLAQAKALYDWVIENTRYDPLAKAFGDTDIGSLLERNALSGRSATISLLFVGLCRSMGIPARPVFGMRIDRSQIFASLGVMRGAGGNLSSSQHCRAEFYSHGYGWIAVDPSDVRKVIFEENLSNHDSKLTVLKKLLFGFWEMNWIAFNAAEEIDLHALGRRTGAASEQENEAPIKPLPYLVYPTVETVQGLFDSGDNVNCEITASRRETF